MSKRRREQDDLSEVTVIRMAFRDPPARRFSNHFLRGLSTEELTNLAATNAEARKEFERRSKKRAKKHSA